MNQQRIITEKKAQVKLVIAILLWGGSFIATKIVLQELTAVTLVWSRFLIGILILAFLAWRRNELRISSWQDAWQFLYLGLIGITFHQWLQSTGLETTEASTTAWIVSSTPVFMALLGWLLLRERITRQSAAGILLAGMGVLLVISRGDFGALVGGNFGKPGDLLVSISAPNWALFSVLSRPILKHHSALKVTFFVLFFGWLLTSIPFIASAGWQEFSQLSLNGWLGIAFLGVFCSALAYVLYYDSLSQLPASQVGAFLYLEPLTATVIAMLVLSEKILLATLAGGGLILLGVWLVDHSSTLTATRKVKRSSSRK